MRATLLLLLASCATGTPPAATMAPATDGDPLPHTPPSAEQAVVGEGPVGLAMSGGFSEARSVALRFLEAVIAGEREPMERLLADRIALAQPRLTAASRQREEVLVTALHPARRRALQSSSTLDSLVLVGSIRASALSVEGEGPGQRLPHGLEAHDVMLTIPLTPAGQRAFRMLLPGWRTEGKVLVRGGSMPRIVGL